MSRAARLAVRRPEAGHPRVGVVRRRVRVLGQWGVREQGGRGQAAPDADPGRRNRFQPGRGTGEGALRREARAASHRARRRDRQAGAATRSCARDTPEHERAVAVERRQGRARSSGRARSRPSSPSMSGWRRARRWTASSRRSSASSSGGSQPPWTRTCRDWTRSAGLRTSSSWSRSTTPRGSRFRF